MIEILRAGTWATMDRLLPAAVMAVIAYAMVLTYLFGFNADLTAQGGVVKNDFLSFWVAAREAVHGMPEIPYQLEQFAQRQFAYLGEGNFYAFFYPPTFLLLVSPLGYLNAMIAFVVFQIAGVLLTGWACSRILGSWHGWLLGAALPATFNSVFHGQSSLLCTGLLGAGLFLLAEKRTILSGVFIGLLTIKPQMGVLIPFALLAGGHFRTFVAAAVTTILFAGLSWLAFGTEAWIAFLAQAEIAGSVLENGQVEFHKMVSIFAGARLIGLTVAQAYLVQGLAALVALLIVVAVWRSQAAFDAKAIVLIAAGYLATPFALSYDLAALAVTLAFAIRLTDGRQGVPWMWTLAALALGITVFARPVGDAFSAPIGPLAPMLFLWIGLNLCDEKQRLGERVAIEKTA